MHRQGAKLSGQQTSEEGVAKFVPSIPEIQRILVKDLKDKPDSFIGSRDWIGSFEVWIIY